LIPRIGVRFFIILYFDRVEIFELKYTPFVNIWYLKYWILIGQMDYIILIPFAEITDYKPGFQSIIIK